MTPWAPLDSPLMKWQLRAQKACYETQGFSENGLEEVTLDLVQGGSGKLPDPVRPVAGLTGPSLAATGQRGLKPGSRKSPERAQKEVPTRVPWGLDQWSRLASGASRGHLGHCPRPTCRAPAISPSFVEHWTSDHCGHPGIIPRCTIPSSSQACAQYRARVVPSVHTRYVTFYPMTDILG